MTTRGEIPDRILGEFQKEFREELLEESLKEFLKIIPGTVNERIPEGITELIP